MMTAKGEAHHPPASVHHGEAYAWLRTLPDASVDAIVTDPPYSSGGAFRADRTGNTGVKYHLKTETAVGTSADFHGDNRDARAFLSWAALWLSECWRVAADGAPVVVFSDWRQLPTMTDALQAGGFVWRGIAVWDKTEGCRPQKGRFAGQAEYMVWGSKGAMPFEREVGCLPGLIRQSAPAMAERHHQTMKPDAVMRYAVNICRPGGTVLDPFTGSGSTAVAAIEAGMGFLGAEMSAHYHETATARIRAAQAGYALQRAKAEQETQIGLFGGVR